VFEVAGSRLAAGSNVTRFALREPAMSAFAPSSDESLVY
jgi:hypothetical protein